jgi:hypothetical protein
MGDSVIFLVCQILGLLLILTVAGGVYLACR